MNKVAIFIGAHPDDLEIGAGGTIAKLTRCEWSIYLVVMTDDSDPPARAIRREEAIHAALSMGVSPDRVIFLGLPDGRLSCTPDVVGQLRDATLSKNPDLVLTHSIADDHQDHRATHDIVCAALRQRPRLYFPVINHLRVSAFNPDVFVDVAEDWNVKLAALRCHKTQQRRINEDNITTHCMGYVQQSGHAYSEPFELELPAGAEARPDLVSSINDSSFHVLWSSLFRGQPAFLLYSVPVSRARPAYHWPPHYDTDGIAYFRKSCNERWVHAAAKFSIEEIRCDQVLADEAMKAGANILLSGGPVTNTITKNYFNHFAGLRYVVDYTMPDHQHIRILDRHSNQTIKATYNKDANGSPGLAVDVGLLTIMKNPYNPNSNIVAVMGIHGFGTMGCYKVICEPILISHLLGLIRLPLMKTGIQLLIRYDVLTGKPELVENSLSMIGWIE